MNLLRTTKILALSICITSAISCGVSTTKTTDASNANRPNQANSSTGAARSNVEELGLLVKVPYEAEDLVWKEYPSQKRLVAIMRLSPADSARLISEAEKVKKPEPATISSETWFPAELIAQAEMSGGDELKGMSYAADQFFQEPYSKGRIIKIENTDYFELELTAN